ncbi:putative cytochrome P450 [Macrophomina phaseolina]|uniref:Cytochrome P450 n=1 Tax=Macrophomina phaseolina TaxID=35725 RepID=A0ABQ8G7C7_9PEZI|nr:putative cytochrome P450 [Macrophomina phaseolina]
MALLAFETLSHVSSTLLGVGVFGLVAYLISLILKIGSRPAHMPPGPPTVPFWGNLRQLSGSFYPEKIYTEWAKSYGPVFTVMKGNQPWVIVTGAAEAHQLFQKHGQSTAGRPSSRMELAMRSGYGPQFMHGPKWRIARKLWHAVLNVGASRQYRPLQQLEAKQLLADVARDGKAWRSHVERYGASLGTTLMNGHRVTGSDDAVVHEIMDDLAVFMRHYNRTAWFDKLPGFWSLPEWAVPARRTAGRIAADHCKLILRHWNETKERIASGLSLPCFNASIMERLKHSDFAGRVTENEAAEIGELLVTAATETTSSTLKNWIAAMTMFPDVQKKAQQEVDRVVGPDRLPDDTDAANLPYVRQVIQETHRWLTAVPLGLIHATTEPVTWGQYVIPAGTPLVLNAYGIHLDPVLYPSPRTFDPDRWAGKLEALSELADDRVGTRSEALYAFGAGRRICPGQHVAEQGLFLAVARWLWAFDTEKCGDMEVDLDAYRPGIVACLENFEATVKPRSAEKAALAEKFWSMDKAEFLDERGQWCKSPQGVENVMRRAVGF